MDSYINTVLWALLKFEAKLWPNKKMYGQNYSCDWIP